VNGKALETVAGKVVRMPECGVACSAGRFLTCNGLADCSYQVYTQENARLDEDGSGRGSQNWFRENVNVVRSTANLLLPTRAPPPVRDCYACRFANNLAHGGTYYGTDGALYSAGYLRFTCPGGASPPAMCSDNQVARYDAATEAVSACGCTPGFYYNSTYGRCDRCLPGYRCAWSGMSPPVLVPCEADTYAEAGAERCTPCRTDSSSCANGQALTRCKGSPAFQSRDARCVPCQECQQLSGDVPCYGVSPKVF
jgi:hypothetical protein